MDKLSRPWFFLSWTVSVNQKKIQKKVPSYRNYPHLPSRELTYPTLRSSENHRLKSAGWDGICDRSQGGSSIHQHFCTTSTGVEESEPLLCASKIQEEEFHQKPTNDDAAVLENLGEKEMKEQLGIRNLWMGKELIIGNLIYHNASIDSKKSFFVPMCFSDHNGSFVFIWVWVSHPGHVTSVSVEVFVFRELEGDLIIKLEGFRPLKPSWGTMPYPTWRGKSTAPPSYLWRG